MDAATIRSLELAKESSDRARSVLLFTQVACIIVFIAAWHEAPSSWMFSRLRVAQAAVWYFDCGAESHPEGWKPTSEFLHENCHTLSKQAPYTDTNDVFTSDEKRQAKQFISTWSLTPAQVHKHLDNLQDSFVNRAMNVTAPLLGFSIDVNDLGLIGGLSLLFLMVWLYFSLRREEDNVRLLFLGAGKDEKKEVYRLACMTQVFTIPPEGDRQTRTGFRLALKSIANLFLKLTLNILFVTPLCAQLFVLWVDGHTISRGKTLNSPLVSKESIYGYLLCGLLFVFTWLCWYRSSRTDKRWAEAKQ